MEARSKDTRVPTAAAEYTRPKQRESPPHRPWRKLQESCLAIRPPRNRSGLQGSWAKWKSRAVAVFAGATSRWRSMETPPAADRRSKLTLKPACRHEFSLWSRRDLAQRAAHA